MNIYDVIKPPISLDFRNKEKKELKEYYSWYIESIPKRIKILEKIVKNTKGYENWNADYNPISLLKLGQWFFENVEIRKRSEKEKEEIYTNSPDWFKQVEIENWELTNTTFSIAIDIGMYLAKVFIKNNPNLKWIHNVKGRKDDANYGQPVLSDFGGDRFNPTQICVTLAYGLARKTNDGKRLKELYDIWCKYI